MTQTVAAAADTEGKQQQKQQTSRHRTFAPFALLPAELRLEIWQHALEAPRIVYVDGLGRRRRIRPRRYWTDGRGRRCEHAHALFFACRESRDVVRRYPRYAFCSFAEKERKGEDRHQRVGRFALTENDVLAVPGDAVLRVNPLVRVSRDVGYGEDGGDGDDEHHGDSGGNGSGSVGGRCRGRGRDKSIPAIRRVLVQVNFDALFDVVGSGPWYPSGWPHTTAMNRAVARETFDRLRSVLGGEGGGGGDGLQTIYCLEDGWAATPRGPKSLHSSLPSTATTSSVWDCEPTFAHMVKLYDKAIDGAKDDG